MMRWWRFNAVGVAGVVVQLGVLWILTSLYRMPYLAATAIAVEIALLHNFVWHETWTWRGQSRDDRWRRLARFQVANGLVSIFGNTLFTWWFRQWLPLLPSNLTAIAVTSLLNFAFAAWWVFDSEPAPAKNS